MNALRDDLLYHICPSLRGEYETKIDSLEWGTAGSSALSTGAAAHRRDPAGVMNWQETPDVDQAAQKAHEKYEEYQDELHRKAQKVQ